MSSRNSCCCCGIKGHNIRTCPDETARDHLLSIMSNPDLESVIEEVNMLEPKYVPYVLVHGFDYAISTVPSVHERRTLLRELITDVHPTLHPPPVVEEEPYVSERDHHRRIRQVEHFSITETYSFVDYLPGHVLCDIELSEEEHAERSASTMREFAFHFMIAFMDNRFLYENLYSDEWLVNAIRAGSHTSHVRFPSQSIFHIINLIRIEHYRMVMATSLDFNLFNDDDDEYDVDVMKVLPIKVSFKRLYSTEQLTCGVCFDDMTAETVVRTGCNHMFCSGCITGIAHTRGIKSFITCPCCRAEISQLCVESDRERDAVIAGLEPIPL